MSIQKHRRDQHASYTLSVSKSLTRAQLKEELKNRLYDRGVSEGRLPGISGISKSKSYRAVSSLSKLPAIKSARDSNNLSHTQNLHMRNVSGSVLISAREQIEDVEESKTLQNPENPRHHRGKTVYNIYKTMNPNESQIKRKKSPVTSTLVKSITGYTTMSGLGPTRVARNDKEIMAIRKAAHKFRYHHGNDSQLETTMKNPLNNTVSFVGGVPASIGTNQDPRAFVDFLRSQDLVAKMSGQSEINLRKLVDQKLSARGGDKSQTRTPAETERRASREPSIDDKVMHWIHKLQEESKNSDEKGAFIYLRAKDYRNPYDLTYCSYADTERTGGRYYTLSSKGFTSYYKNYADEFTSIVDWVVERELFDKLKQVSIFKLFRAWKVMKIWRHNVIIGTRKSVKQQLEKNLIHTRAGFINVLLMHQANCRHLESQRLFDVTDQDSAVTLEQFRTMQEDHCARMAEKVEETSRRTQKMFMEQLERTLESLRVQIRKTQEETESKEENQPNGEDNIGTFMKTLANQMSKKQKKPQNVTPLYGGAIYEQIGFPQNLSYAYRSEIKKQCKIFLRFSYLLDLIAKTAVTNLYVKSMQSLNDYFIKKNCLTIPRELPAVKQSGEYIINDALKPVLLINVDITESQIPEQRLKSESVEAFEPPPLGYFDVNNFDPTCHLETFTESQQNRIGRKTRRNTVERIGECWVKIKPEIHEIKKVLLNCVEGMLLVAKQYEKHSDTEELVAYANIVDESEGRVEDRSSKERDTKLNFDEILMERPEYVKRNEYVEKFIVCMKSNLEEYLLLFDPYLLWHWKYMHIPWQNINGDQLQYPIDCISLLARQIRKHKDDFSSHIPITSEVGFTKLTLNKLKDKLTRSPAHALKKLDEIMPSYLVTECEKVKSWLEKWQYKITGAVDSAIKYVDQYTSIKYVEANIDNYVFKIETISSIFSLCKLHNIKIAKEDLYNELVQLVKDVGLGITDVKEKGDRKKKQFKNELRRSVDKIRADTYALSTEVNSSVLLKWTDDIDHILEKIMALQDKCTAMKEEVTQCINIQMALEAESTQFDFVDEVSSEIDLRLDLWTSLRDFKNLTSSWRVIKFACINTTEIEERTSYFSKIVLRCENRGHKDSTAVQELKKDVMLFKESIPIVEALGNKKLKAVHWKEIKTVIKTGMDLETRGFTLETLIELGAMIHSETIHNISITASQESILKKQMKQIKIKWEKRGFVLKQYTKESSREQLTIITESSLLFVDLDEAVATINTMLGSSYARRLLDRIFALKQQFDSLWQVVEEWLHCQRSWLYLDNIFSSSDIRSHLKKETADFEIVDKQWKQVMKSISAQSRNILLNFANSEQLEKLAKINRNMDKIKKELQHYLETKRREFPRFYFLSDGELLPVMSKSKSISVIEPILPKCFEGIVKLELGQNKLNTEIVGMCSSEGENIPFKTIRTYGDETIVQWLKSVESNMIEVLRRLIKTGYNEYFQGDADRKKWVLKHCSQVVSCVSQLTWTEGCEYAIKELAEDPSALSELWQQSSTQINLLIDAINEKITPVQRNIIISLITKDVHWRDVVEKLAAENVSTIHDFPWQVQLRYYIEDVADMEEVVVKQVNAEILYGYEYVGGSSQLVITPLTERCYLTITSALHIHLGAAPSGPAGTGKTETVKDLAKAVATQCVVFNCSEQMEIKIMARLLSGLILQGAWACLDEFNRIDIEVLSVIAQQLLQIKDSLRSGAKTLIFDDMEMAIKQSVGVFVTMNPDYAGRTELPDNLKILFRPVAMMIPDYTLITEILLFAQGFKDAKRLATKLTQLYKLASEQLSAQDHYDFGMRAVKSVLVLAGSLRQKNSTALEDLLLIQAIKYASVPKFVHEDLELFLQLVQDLFPGMYIPTEDHGVLTEELMNYMKRTGLKAGNGFVTKVQQLYESLEVRFGVMIIGQPGVGKSTCYQALQETITALSKRKDLKYQQVDAHVILPKALSLGELYGEESKDTKEWKYGIASKLMKKATEHHKEKILNYKDEEKEKDREKEEETKKTTWIVFDGPIEPKWVENMNSVLDDSKMLCLANAERIKLTDQMRILFEVQDLYSASLATVSRCGMVYISGIDVGWKAYLDSWAEKAVQTTELYTSSEDLKGVLLYMLDNTVDKVVAEVDVIRKSHAIPATIIQMLKSFTASLDYWATKIKLSDPLELRKRRLTAYFVFSLVWSFGGLMTQSGRQTIDEVVRPLFPKLSAPYSGTLFDYNIEVAENNQVRWPHWRDQVPQYVSPSQPAHNKIFVPTIDSTKYSYLLQISLEMFRPVFFVGETGVGKSVMIQNLLNKKSGDSTLHVLSLVFSATSSSADTQLAIEAKMEPKRGRTTLGPPGQSKGVVFIDDINMPVRESSGAQPPVELLRQLLTYNGFYGRVKHKWINIVNTTLLCAAAPPGGGRNPLSQRFTHLFNVFWIPDPNSDTLRYIFENILVRFLLGSPFSDPVKRLGTVVVGSVVELYLSISSNLKPIPSKFYYTFNLRDVSKVFQSMLMTTPRTIGSAEVFARLWIHECMRVFGDRLSNEKDRRWLQDSIIGLLNSRFRYDWSWEEVFEKKQIIFTDIHRGDMEPKQRPYEEIVDIKRLAKVLDEMLIEYNHKNMNNKMDLVFFDQAVCYIAAISRSLQHSQSNCLLIGVSGCGKESYCSLSAFMLNSIFFKIRTGKNYRKDNFKEDIKGIMRIAGVEGKSIVFMMNEYQLTNEYFLEDINSILNTGEVNNLYRSDEMDAIIKDMGPVVTQLKRLETRESKYSTFLERVRENLHIALSMSPIGEAFRNNCRKYPSLINCCTMIYFDKWPEQAFQSVCSKLISQTDIINKNLLTSFVKMFPQVHLSVSEQSITYYEEQRRKFYVTPKSYIDAIKFFIKSLQTTQQKQRDIIERLAKGLRNFLATNRMVTQLKETLKKLQPIIEENTVKTMNALDMKELESKKVAEEEDKIENQKNHIYQQKTMIELSQAEARKELSKVQPLLEDARLGLESINAKDIAKIRSYPKPPKMVMTVMEAVGILLLNDRKEVKITWDGAKDLLNEKGFFKKLKELNYAKLTKSTIKALHEYTVGFDPKEIAQSDTASVSLANWCVAMEKCYETYQKVAPQEEKLKRIQIEYENKQKEVMRMEEALDRIKQKCKQLEMECRKLGDEARIITEKKEKTGYQLVNAELLTKLLQHEGQRWSNIIDKLKENEKYIVGNVFLSAISISYIGPFTMKYREQLLLSWKELCNVNNIPFSPDYSIISTLGNLVEMGMWNLRGLPQDRISMENAILAKKSQRWPLMIDPEGQANRWIRNVEKQNDLIVIKMASESSENIKSIMQAIQTGKPLLIEDVGQEFDSSLYTVLGKKTFRSDVGERIYVGDKEIQYDSNFTLYLTSKIPNPHFMPEICIMLNVVNFAVTYDALEEQLLVEVILIEKPEVEAERIKKIAEISIFQKQLHDIEEEILEKLTNATEDTILMNVDLIKSLEKTKKSSAEIEKNIKEAQSAEVLINNAREQYRSVAARGTVLYFILIDIAKLNVMYQFSFNFLKRLFIKAIESVKEIQGNPEERKQVMIRKVTEIVYSHVSFGLFEEHKLVLSFLMTTYIQMKEGTISQDELDIFIRNAGVVSKEEAKELRRPKAFSESSWLLACTAESKLKNFAGFIDSFLIHDEKWIEYINCADPYSEKSLIPYSKGNQLNGLERLILVKILAPQKICSSCVKYVTEYLGPYYTDYRSARLEDVFEDSCNYTPIIFVLGQGMDPTEQIMSIARILKTGLSIISLGKEQEVKAEKELNEAKKIGKWLLLQNCHLAKSFMPKLELLATNLENEASTLHPQFRLLLTSTPIDYFPSSILQVGLKCTTEAPAGIKAHLHSAYSEITEDYLKSCPKKREWKLLLFGISLFHAVVQERGKFGSLGWNIKYVFNETDLETSKEMLKDFLIKQDVLAWDALKFITGNINYGGRVTDDFDRKVLLATFHQFVNPKMLSEKDFKFAEPVAYKQREPGTVKEYLDFILTLPGYDDTSLFGMQENANVTHQAKLSNNFLSCLISAQPKIRSKSSASSNDDFIHELIVKLNETLPATFEEDAPRKAGEAKSSLNPLRTVLKHEIEKYNSLLNVISTSLKNLEKAIKGEVVMSQELDGIYSSLLVYKVPEQWKAYDSMKPLGSWFPNLNTRVDFMRKWKTNLNIRCYIFPYFIFPQGFLTAVLQMYAREQLKPIDTLTFQIDVTTHSSPDYLAANPKTGVYIYGLYLEGAAWNPSKQLLFDSPKGQLSMQMPVMTVIPSSEQKSKEIQCYQCPIYKTASRKGALTTTGISSGYIISVDLPTNEPSEKWTLRGTAMLCELPN